MSDPRIFAVGDCAAVPGSRPACYTATPQAAHAADTLARILRGAALRPYSLGYAGTCISLGRRDGVLQLARRDDSPRRSYAAGRAVAMLKEGVFAGLRYGLRSANIAWLPGPK